MKIDSDLIKYLEGLSRLTLSDDERGSVAGDIEGILKHMGQLGELETEAVEPLSHPFPLGAALRCDESAPGFDRGRIMENAPDKKDGYFVVPKTVE